MRFVMLDSASSGEPPRFISRTARPNSSPMGPVGGRLKEPVQRVAEARGLGQRRGAGRRASVGGEARLKVLRAAGGAPHLADAEEEQEDSCEGDQPENHGDWWHLNLLEDQYSLSGDGCLLGENSCSETSSPSDLKCSMRMGTTPVAE